MKTAFALLFLGLSTLAQADVSLDYPSYTSITWIKFQRSAVVKIDTPGYPLWLMDKANAPILHEQAENFYWPQDKPSAVLLNITMSLDNKTLLVNHKPILPLADSNIPPLIEAYQVPADITASQIKGLTSNGLLNRHWEGLTLGWRYLALDYDRLVWSDPEQGPWQNHVPTLSFRIMGIGAHSRSDVLDSSKQKVLHITLADSNHGSSNSPDRLYGITKIELKHIEDSYAYVPATEPERKECTLSSWKCPDKGLYREGAPWYRFIWRERFDKYGRVGSLRHALVKKMDAVLRILRDAGPSMVLSFIILMSAALAIMGIIGIVKHCVGKREKRIRDLAEDDRLLGVKEGDDEMDFRERYTDEDGEGIPPPLPPRPVVAEKDVLIDLESTETA
ncbi:hypothetical protein K469DRAFT_659866 [Zopfia rhizophila CBS 207.26]|uniref:Uncharacterized protein n=1 Tax=Zopfia rhizophila CBS 207.26 TaxID=1314779 RepID=A0A6A6ECP2_9PEZI|nr:hypothetical protein K469DRAFT_659866 [Zopfia rhizophila CBS 207.26]